MPVIFFRTNELFQFGRTTAASQYFLQMAGFLGIPVIAWNADNAGLETVRETYDIQFRPSEFLYGLSKIAQVLELCSSRLLKELSF